jgi:hypothetical protein
VRVVTEAKSEAQAREMVNSLMARIKN